MQEDLTHEEKGTIAVYAEEFKHTNKVFLSIQIIIFF
jgi:hypothetical protein